MQEANRHQKLTFGMARGYQQLRAIANLRHGGGAGLVIAINVHSVNSQF